MERHKESGSAIQVEFFLNRDSGIDDETVRPYQDA
jgi:hypothetical protein